MKRELFGVSRKTFFKWLKRYRVYGKEGLINKRAGAKKNGRRTSSSVEDLIVKMRLDTPFGPLRIAYAKLYRRKTAANSLSFLKELYKFFDCRIQSILTDNGLEFTNIRGVPGSHILDEFCLKNSGK